MQFVVLFAYEKAPFAVEVEVEQMPESGNAQSDILSVRLLILELELEYWLVATIHQPLLVRGRVPGILVRLRFLVIEHFDLFI